MTTTKIADCSTRTVRPQPTAATASENATMTRELAAPSDPAPTAATPAAPAADLAAILASLDAIKAALGPTAAPLTIDRRRRLLKMRPGGEEHVAPVMDAAQRYGLVLPGVDNAAVADSLAFLRELAPVRARLVSLNALVADLTLTKESLVWKATMATYSTLARCVVPHPSLQVELAPMASFLAVRFKDAPGAIRPQEKRALAKARRARKADAEAAASAPPGSNPPDGTAPHAAPPPTA